MKKNTMMRLASFLLIAVLITTSAISGTYAKYVTQDSASDSARVAKWGVTVLASGTLFGENYFPNSATEYKNEISAEVQNSVDVDANGGNIVAPGTQNSIGMTFAVKGTPEVANVINVTSTEKTEEEVWLLKGKYGVLVDATSSVTADNVENYYVASGNNYIHATTYSDNAKYYELHDEAVVTSDKYYPIIWTIKNTVGTNNPTTVTKSTLADVVTEITTALKTANDAQNNPNVAIDETVNVTWAWAFEGQNDGADTILGNLQSNVNSENYVVVKETGTNDTWTNLVDGEDYNLDLAFDIKITVTQVD